jgi:hypothetical protein
VAKLSVTTYAATTHPVQAIKSRHCSLNFKSPLVLASPVSEKTNLPRDLVAPAEPILGKKLQLMANNQLFRN